MGGWEAEEHCTMRTRESRNSSGLLAPGDIFKNHQKYLMKRHFFFKLTTRRKIEKIQFPSVSNSRFSIFLQNVHSVVCRIQSYLKWLCVWYRGIKISPSSSCRSSKEISRCNCVWYDSITDASVYRGILLYIVCIVQCFCIKIGIKM